MRRALLLQAAQTAEWKHSNMGVQLSEINIYWFRLQGIFFGLRAIFMVAERMRAAK